MYRIWPEQDHLIALSNDYGLIVSGTVAFRECSIAITGCFLAFGSPEDFSVECAGDLSKFPQHPSLATSLFLLSPSMFFRLRLSRSPPIPMHAALANERAGFFMPSFGTHKNPRQRPASEVGARKSSLGP
jgi:hypothetical protein